MAVAINDGPGRRMTLSEFLVAIACGGTPVSVLDDEGPSRKRHHAFGGNRGDIPLLGNVVVAGHRDGVSGPLERRQHPVRADIASMDHEVSTVDERCNPLVEHSVGVADENRPNFSARAEV